MTFISARKPLSDLTCYRKMKVTGSECKHKGKYKVSVNIFLWILPIVQFNISFLKFLRYFHCVWWCKARFRPHSTSFMKCIGLLLQTYVVSSQIKTLYKYKYKANLNFSELSDKRKKRPWIYYTGSSPNLMKLDYIYIYIPTET